MCMYLLYVYVWATSSAPSAAICTSRWELKGFITNSDSSFSICVYIYIYMYGSYMHTYVYIYIHTYLYIYIYIYNMLDAHIYKLLIVQCIFRDASTTMMCSVEIDWQTPHGSGCSSGRYAKSWPFTAEPRDYRTCN